MKSFKLDSHISPTNDIIQYEVIILSTPGAKVDTDC